MLKGDSKTWNYSFFNIDIRAVSQSNNEKPCAREISPTVIHIFHSINHF